MIRDPIKEEMKRRGWTTYRLTQETGLGKATVYDFLSGDREIQTDSLERICEALDLELRSKDED
jgi:DNA-binding Xre family transcriptional regulator